MWDVDVQREGEMRDEEKLVETVTDWCEGEQHHKRVRDTSDQTQYLPFFIESALRADKGVYEYTHAKRMDSIRT